MNQREATVTLLEFVREQAPEERRIKAAVKVLEKRCEVLRTRYERRHATVADDLFEEPLTVTFAQFCSLFRADVCVACCDFKEEHVAFCAKCFANLEAPTAKAFKSHTTIHHGFCRALRFFGRHPKQGEDGMLGWPDEPGVNHRHAL